MLDRYAARYGITDPDGFEEFVALIREMDAAFIEHDHATRD